MANQKRKTDLVDALIKEINLQQDFFGKDTIQTIYFGGGTPSILSIQQLEKILGALYQNFHIESNIELTLEANPENLNAEYLAALKKSGFNRLSIGIQSFNDDDLALMKRTHSSEIAIQAVDHAKNQDFKNISIDLIYGLPGLSLKKWGQNLKKAIDLNIQHISAYHLTIEPKTLFKKWYDQKKIFLPGDEKSLEQYQLLVEKTSENGFLHYEISNFAKDGFISLHNTNYWMGVKYLGLGPSAHSYNLTSRQWNISNLHVYLDTISNGKTPFESEKLTLNEKYNDYIITSLRTMWGLNTEMIELNFGLKYKNYFLKNVKRFLDEKLFIKNGHQIKLSDNGMFVSDSVISELFYE